MHELKYFLVQFIELYTYVLMIRMVLSFFPAVDWYKQPFRLLSSLTDPVLAPFRGLIPPVGGLDFSPILLFLALQLLQGVIAGM